MNCAEFWRDWKKLKKRNRAFKFAAAVLVSLLGWILLAPCLATLLIVEKPLARADAIFVLSGSAAYIERNQKAAALYRRGVAPKIFLTDDGVKGGWDKKERRNPFYVERARWELMGQGVPEDAIEVLPGTVEGTEDEAKLFAEAAREKDLKSVLLVTSAYHTRRTFWTFENSAKKNDLAIEIGIESPPTGQQTPPPFYWWATATGWRVVGAEYVKIVYYWFFY